ncbi:hypothetical protein ACIGNX_10250 [Actinosynnema sp. NPDC053489]|uniref:hypothetical protein n=1 Tax=Actinosynnema sp. NPDC053489 TaxID=3363916 RepID=UPI0037CBFD9E
MANVHHQPRNGPWTACRAGRRSSRFTSGAVDSFALVAISGAAMFTGIPRPLSEVTPGGRATLPPPAGSRCRSPFRVMWRHVLGGRRDSPVTGHPIREVGGPEGATMGTTGADRRQRILAFATSGATALSGIVINFATEWKSNPLAWLVVLLVTVVSGLLALMGNRPVGTSGTGRADAAPAASASARGTGNVVTNNLSYVVHHNSSALALIVVVALVVLAAGTGGLLANRLLDHDGTAAPASGRAAPTEPIPFTHAVRKITPTCGAPWITPKPPEQIRLPVPQEVTSHGGWSEWDQVNEGGAAASPGQVMITVQGRSDAQVVLTDLRVRVVARREPLRGTAVVRQCGGPGVVRRLSVDLDRDPVAPTAEDQFGATDPDTPQWERKPIKFPYTVSLTDTETFVVEAKTDGCDCDWVIDLHWASQGQVGVLPITDDGHPFRTSSRRNARTCAVLDTEFACY